MMVFFIGTCNPQNRLSHPANQVIPKCHLILFVGGPLAYIFHKILAKKTKRNLPITFVNCDTSSRKYRNRDTSFETDRPLNRRVMKMLIKNFYRKFIKIEALN